MDAAPSSSSSKLKQPQSANRRTPMASSASPASARTEKSEKDDLRNKHEIVGTTIKEVFGNMQIESEVNVIKEVLGAQMDEPQETGPQLGMTNLPMDNVINAERDSVVENMEKLHIFVALKSASPTTDCTSHEACLSPGFGEEMREECWNPLYRD